MVLTHCQDGTCTSYLVEPLTEAPKSQVLLTPTSSETIGPGNRVYVTAGDFLGESLRVGPPTFRIQEEMTTPIAFLNLPPMHRNIVWNESSEEFEVIELIT